MAPRACKFHCWYKAPQNTLSIKHLNMSKLVEALLHDQGLKYCHHS